MKLWCSSCKTSQEMEVPDTSLDDYFSFTCVSCGSKSLYPTESCGCVVMNKGSGAEYDYFICPYHEGLMAFSENIIELLPLDALVNQSPFSAKDLPESLPKITVNDGLKAGSLLWSGVIEANKEFLKERLANLHVPSVFRSLEGRIISGSLRPECDFFFTDVLLDVYDVDDNVLARNFYSQNLGT